MTRMKALNNDIERNVQQLARLLQSHGMTLAVAESCTGGGLAYALTALSGSSAWFERGYVTYSNQAKMDCLAVPAATIEQYGAVSEQTAKAMAQGVVKASGADCGISVTGVAGPDGGTDAKPVGTVCFGFCVPGQPAQVFTQHFMGGRAAIRTESIDFSLRTLQEIL